MGLVTFSSESWGGCDDWEFTFEPEITRPPPPLSRSTSDVLDTEAESEQGGGVRGRRYEEAGTDHDSFQSFSTSSQQSLRKQAVLLRLSPSQDIIFSPNSYGDLTARIQMSNVSSSVVAFKMKTTTPERFKVKPSTGCLSPGDSSMMDISVTKSHLSQSDNIGN